MYQITKEEDTRVVLETPLAARNHFKEGVVAYLIEAQFLESLKYIKINALLYTFLYLFPMMWIIMYNRHSLWVYLCTFSTYFIFLPQEILKLYGQKPGQYFDLYWNRLNFMQIVLFTWFGGTFYLVSDLNHNKHQVYMQILNIMDVGC